MSQYSPPARQRNDVPTFLRIHDADAATLAPEPDNTGGVFLCNRAAGITVTLPKILPELVGMHFHFVVATAVTSNKIEIATAGELLIGDALAIDTDTANTHARYAPDGTDDVKVTLNGTTTGGGVGGDRIDLVAVKIGSDYLWLVSGIVNITGNSTTPFS